MVHVVIISSVTNENRSKTSDIIAAEVVKTMLPRQGCNHLGMKGTHSSLATVENYYILTNNKVEDIYISKQQQLYTMSACVIYRV